MPLLEYITSTQQVEQKMLRNVTANLKEKFKENEVQAYCWLETKCMLVDILTKEKNI